MTTTIRLNEKDIREAIIEWCSKKDLKVKSDSVGKGVYMWQDIGDPPLSGPSIYANVEVE